MNSFSKGCVITSLQRERERESIPKIVKDKAIWARGREGIHVASIFVFKPLSKKFSSESFIFCSWLEVKVSLKAASTAQIEELRVAVERGDKEVGGEEFDDLAVTEGVRDSCQ